MVGEQLLHVTRCDHMGLFLQQLMVRVLALNPKKQDVHSNYVLSMKPRRNKLLCVFCFIDQNPLLDFSGHLGRVWRL